MGRSYKRVANTAWSVYLCTVLKKLPLPLLVVAALASWLWLPNLFAKGMFMDGVYNAFFALNIKNGIGSLWAQQTIYHSQPAYWDNPQFSSLLLSYWFEVFGNAYWVERVYSLFTGVIQMLLLVCLWRSYFHNNSALRVNYWLPCLLFLFSPITSWCYSNNLMENTMSVFTTGAVLAFVIWLRKGKYMVLMAIAGGAIIVLATITKGPVGLFPLTVPLFFILDKKRNPVQLIIYFLFQFGSFIISFYTVFSSPSACNFLENYLQLQLFPVLKERVQTGSNHFIIFYELLRGILPLLLVSATGFLVFKKKNMAVRVPMDAIIFIAIGLSASVPIAFSGRQHHYYLLPSLPMFAFGVAVMVYPFANWLLNKTEKAVSGKFSSYLKVVLVFLISTAGLISLNNSGSYVRDELLLKDMEAICPITNGEKLLNADYSFFHEWSMRGYLYRFYGQKICMPDEGVVTKYFFAKPGTAVTNAENVFAGKTFDLYKKKP